jgi:hypothetical protein
MWTTEKITLADNFGNANFILYICNMKECTKCHFPKDESEFRSNKRKIDGLDDYCKPCRRQCDKITYNNHIENNRRLGLQSKLKTRKRNYDFVKEYLQTHPCVDCNETDIVVLEFDHKGDKDKAVSSIINNCSLERLIKEIEKCEVRCANCHRRKTAKDFNYYKLSGGEN